MDKKKLNRYVGELISAQISQGVNAALDNACRLVSDAELLFNSKRYASATALAILAIEEAGKLDIFRELSLAQTREELDFAWKAYRTYSKKNTNWIIFALIASGLRNPEDLRQMVEERAKYPYILDNIKQLSLHTECLDNAQWSVPMDVITEEMAHVMLSIARFLARAPHVTEKKVDVWKRSLGPVRKTASWATDMWKNSLITHDLLDKLLEYADGGSVGEPIE